MAVPYSWFAGSGSYRFASTVYRLSALVADVASLCLCNLAVRSEESFPI